jgi:3',5'-nucleoside bisphosphate phosphatase
MRLDLHLHSSASDGKLLPRELVTHARAAGLDVIALCDHDTTAGHAEAAAAAAAAGPRACRVIPAVELSSTAGGHDLHFLGYFIDPEDPAMRRHQQEAVARREERVQGMIARLASLGFPIEFDDVLRLAGPGSHALGRPHVARALIERGHVRTFAEAFDRFLRDGGPAFLPTELMDPEAAIALIHRIGGLSVWAHPPLDTLRAALPRYAAAGLDGIECFRPRHLPAETKELVESAARLGLIRSGGSDWHGEWHGRLGEFFVAPDQVPELSARLGAA